MGVARALAADPEILLMDEPFGALDAITRLALQQEMARLHGATGKTILLVTHDVEEALALATRIAVMADGRLLQEGAPRDLLDAPADPRVRRPARWRRDRHAPAVAGACGQPGAGRGRPGRPAAPAARRDLPRCAGSHAGGAREEVGAGPMTGAPRGLVGLRDLLRA